MEGHSQTSGVGARAARLPGTHPEEVFEERGQKCHEHPGGSLLPGQVDGIVDYFAERDALCSVVTVVAIGRSQGMGGLHGVFKAASDRSMAGAEMLPKTRGFVGSAAQMPFG